MENNKLKAEKIVQNVKEMRENYYNDDVKYFIYIKGLKQTLDVVSDESLTEYVLELLESEGLLTPRN